ncbi:MAG: hypothetical protein JWM34_3614 [Ilumatobacteraceae bacterium]|nr:hypothetical protein [Ilumatobacteraceae bacterium]
MIRLGFRLAVAGGREAITRLALIVVAVAIGVALLLTTVASINALHAQNGRYAWLETGYSGAAVAASADGPQHDPIWWRLTADHFGGQRIGRVDVAATGTNSPLPPGIPELPRPGTFYASPALAKLLRDTPADELGDRFPGTQIGTIGPDALPAPDSLVIVIGRRVAELDHGGAILVTQISTTSPSQCRGECAFQVGTDDNGIILILSVVAAALLFPVLVFIGGATRLSATRREQRFAAMRLVGATPRQISTLSTVESVVATVIGIALGFGLFVVARSEIAKIPFTGARFFTSDLTVDRTDILLIVIGLPLAAAVAARIALRRVQISPLGVSRRVTPRSPRAWRVLPVLAGIGWLTYLAATDDVAGWTSQDQAYAYLAGVFTVMIGLVVSGPWVTMVGSRFLAARAKRPASLIAARRLGDSPSTGFRAISGLVLAVFVASCAIGIITGIESGNAGAAGSTADAKGLLQESFFGPDEQQPATAAVGAGGLDDLSSVPGVQGTIVVRQSGRDQPFPPPPMLIARCDQLATTTALGRCAPGAELASVLIDFGGAVIDRSKPMTQITWPSSTLSLEQFEALPVQSIIVATDGTTSAVERARTVLERNIVVIDGPETVTEQNAEHTHLVDSYRRLANVVLLTSLPIAGCSLAVSVAGSLAERRRPFSLLRLTGVPLSTLRRVVTLEAAVPLLIGVVVSACVGLLSAALFLRAQLGEALQPPSVGYYALLAGGTLVSLAIIASNLPLLARLTGPESARND